MDLPCVLLFFFFFDNSKPSKICLNLPRSILQAKSQVIVLTHSYSWLVMSLGKIIGENRCHSEESLNACLPAVCLWSDLGVPYRTNLSTSLDEGKNPVVRVHIGLNKNVVPVNTPGL